jgi:hypothetical protein
MEALRTYPLHVDHVAEAVMRSITDPERQGVVDVELMRQWAGFGGAGAATPTSAATAGDDPLSGGAVAP